jgi:hypothetical protein
MVPLFTYSICIYEIHNVIEAITTTQGGKNFVIELFTSIQNNRLVRSCLMVDKVMTQQLDLEGLGFRVQGLGFLGRRSWYRKTSRPDCFVLRTLNTP